MKMNQIILAVCGIAAALFLGAGNVSAQMTTAAAAAAAVGATSTRPRCSNA